MTGLTDEEWRFTVYREQVEFEREVAQAALERSRADYRKALESVADLRQQLAALTRDQERRVKAFSDTVEKLFNSTTAHPTRETK